MLEKLEILALLLTIVISLPPSPQPCSPICGSGGTCLDSFSANCSSCDATVYALNTSASSHCQLISPNVLITQELTMIGSTFNLTPYSSNKVLSTISCGGLISLSPLSDGDYIARVFTGLGVNHYQFVLMFGITRLSPSTYSANTLTLVIPQVTTLINPISLASNCAASFQVTLTGCVPTLICQLTNQFTLAHSVDTLTFNLTAPAGSITLGEGWALHDLVLILSLCDPSCATCLGPSVGNCITCVIGLFLLGNACIPTCPYFAMPSISVCVMICPAYYYQNTINSFCQPCPSGCATCLSTDTCITWDAPANPRNVFFDNMALWIIIIVAFFFLFAAIIWKCCLSRKSTMDEMEEQVLHPQPQQKAINNPKIDNTNLSTEQMQILPEKLQAHWIEDIDQINMNKVKLKKKLNINDDLEGIGKLS